MAGKTPAKDAKKKRAPAKKVKRGTRKVRDWRPLFLEALSQYGNISHAARDAGVARRFVYTEKKRNKKFAEEWAQAEENAADALEEEARRRAAEGVEEPVFYQGVIAGYVRRYSDVLLIFLLKGLRPEKFRERHENAIQGKLEIEVKYVDGLTR